MSFEANKDLLSGVGDREEYNRNACETIALHFKNYLMYFKEKMLDGSISISPDKNRISNEVWEKCKKLSDKGFVIGGSVVLNLYGIVDREVGDIDVFRSVDEIDFDVEEHEEVDTEDENGYSENDFRVKVNVDGVGIMDVFNQRVDFYLYDGVKINSPFTALNAKIGYKRSKDIKDFLYMVRNIENV